MILKVVNPLAKCVISILSILIYIDFLFFKAVNILITFLLNDKKQHIFVVKVWLSNYGIDQLYSFFFKKKDFKHCEISFRSLK